jgi:hypothetical protein
LQVNGVSHTPRAGGALGPLLADVVLGYFVDMPDSDVLPAPPDGIRPGQLGMVLLGRVIIGDVAATLVDLSLRRLLRVLEPDDEPGGWLISALHTSAPRHRRDSLLGYEQTLLDGLTCAGTGASLPALASRMPGLLDHTRQELVRDAVRHGWLRHLHHDQRTEAGEELAARIRSFQRRLRQAAAGPGRQDLLNDRLLPYAMHFGMVRDDQQPLVRFARAWVDTFARLPGWHEPAAEPPNPLSDPVPKGESTPGYGYGYPR